MNNFKFYNPCQIYFGKEQEKQVGSLCKQYTDKVLLVYGKNSIKVNGIYDKVIASLKENGVDYIELSGVKGNPEMDLVYKGIEICKSENIGLVLAVGGGSVIDTAKGISAGACYDGDVWDFYLRKCKPTKALPVATVLTVVGAGSEMSNSNVVTMAEQNLKRDFDNETIIPKFSILNPEFTYTVSPYQTACGSFDAISHLLERYFTPTKNTDVTDRMIEALIKTLMTFTPLAMEDPTNYDYRAEIMWAATLAQNGLMNTGRDGDWACHKIEHELSGEFDIPHGEGLAMIYPEWLSYVCKADMNRFKQFGRRVLDVDIVAYDDEIIAKAIVNAFVDFEKKIGLKTDVTSLNMSDDQMKMLAKRTCWNSDTKGKFMKLTSDDIYNILKNANQ